MAKFRFSLSKYNKKTDNYKDIYKGIIKSITRAGAVDKIMERYKFTEDNIVDAESGGWGGRPDNYEFLTLEKNNIQYELEVTDI